MRAAKTHFDQIPVETVKKITTELAQTDGIPNSRISDEMQDEITSSPQRWRQVAQQVQQERDPTKMIELVQHLLTEFDQAQLIKQRKLTY